MEAVFYDITERMCFQLITCRLARPTCCQSLITSKSLKILGMSCKSRMTLVFGVANFCFIISSTKRALKSETEVKPEYVIQALNDGYDVKRARQFQLAT